ncbi:hypothetical protein [Acinetobacter sp. SFA]|uniref:hypothetical protein n=1 Tax=unclassified Acinetobacter TaxID=196816 RepID=UPI0007D09C98|nr:hypothetical protein [Acinetobacter sp. SFA]OAL82175.1 hypothetical protein AY607_13050 [Acinetobacter sp. SFA]
MIGHQRDILATLGIDLWIPRDSACQPHQVSIWRDQAEPEFHTEIVLSQPHPVEALVELPIPEPESLDTFKIDTSPTLPEVLTVQEPEVLTVQEPRESVQIPPFSLQALSLAHCSVVIDATEMTEATLNLWANIQRAVSGDFYELNWPFPWANVQDGRGVESYIQGFLDGMSTEKHIIFLGTVAHISNIKAIQLASLQEMLDQPILKKRLWQFMQNRSARLE